MATLYASQTPASTGNDNEHSLGNKFTFSSSGFSAVRGRVWVPSGGLAASNTVWQLWNADTSTMLAEFDLTTLTGETPNAWSPWFNIGPVALSTSVNYIVCWHMPTGDPGYVYSAQTFPLANSPFTATAGVFSTAEASTVMPTSEFDALYFADIEATSGASDVTVNLASGVDSAMAVTATSVVDAAAGLVTETDSAFSVTPASVSDVTVSLATEIDSAFTITPGGGSVTTPSGDLSATYYLNQLAGTLVAGQPTLTAAAAAKVWAGVAFDLTEVAAYNIEAENILPQWLAIQGVLNEIAGTKDLSVHDALRVIAGQ